MTNVLKILIFKILDVYMGIDVSLIYEMTVPALVVDKSIELTYIDTLIPFRKNIVKYNNPMALIINDEYKKNGIIIDMPLDIIELNIKSVKPLPFLIERCVHNAIWGTFIKGDDIVLLLDIFRFET